MSLFLEWLRAVAIKLAAGWGAGVLSRHGRTAWSLLPPWSWTRYRRETAANAREIPFIYRDLDLDVAGSFVEPDVVPLEPEDLSQRSAQSTLELSLRDRLRLKRRVIFLGDAGVGKTTLQKRTILDLGRSESSEFLHPRERPIPLYVPLKAVKNTVPSPIVQYLLDSVSPLHVNGLSKLSKLATSRRLFLFLDGYDEVSWQHENEWLRKELSVLFGPQDRPIPDSLSEHAELYQALFNNRVWLSSRRDFFYVNSVAGIGDGTHPSAGDRPSVMEIRGVQSNRATLVAHIFDRYRARSERYADQLSEELFLSLVDTAPDDELADLSSNPLFLTVLSYVYVKRVIDEGLPSRDWFVAVDDVIKECTRLLINDLDEEKARRLSFVQRQALLSRRNQFSDEKLQFLQWFALDLYKAGMAIFDKDHLHSKAAEFFGMVHPDIKEENRRAIQRYLQSDSWDPRAIHNQLIFCGLFVRVEGVGKRELFDFPHRRFREVLAIARLRLPHESNVFFGLPNAETSELMLLAFRRPELRSEVLNALLSATAVEPESTRAGRTILRALERARGDFVPWSHFREFFSRHIGLGSRFLLPRPLWEMIPHDSAWVGELVREVREGVDEDRRHAVNISATLLGFLSLDTLAILARELAGSTDCPETLEPLVRELARHSPSELVDLEVSAPFSEIRNSLSLHFITRAVAGRPESYTSYRKLNASLPKLGRANLAYWMERHDRATYRMIHHPKEDDSRNAGKQEDSDDFLRADSLGGQIPQGPQLPNLVDDGALVEDGDST